eukprot:2701468-Pyramimonas_sp.AAC.1
MENPLAQMVKVPGRVPYVRLAGCKQRPLALLRPQLAEAVPGRPARLTRSEPSPFILPSSSSLA